MVMSQLAVQEMPVSGISVIMNVKIVLLYPTFCLSPVFHDNRHCNLKMFGSSKTMVGDTKRYDIFGLQGSYVLKTP